MVNKFGEIGPPWFDDKPVALVGGGLSLVGFDLAQLREHCHVIAVKGSIFDMPWADCGVGIDLPRYIEWRSRFHGIGFPVYWAVDNATLESLVDTARCMVFLRKLYGYGIGTRLDSLYTGGTSGFAGLGLAVLKKARRIYLFGYDYRTPMHRSKGVPHRHNDQHYASDRHQSNQHLAGWAVYYERVTKQLQERHVQVFNCSPDSAITCFPRLTHGQALKQLTA